MSKISLHTLKYNVGSIKRRKRVGRGCGSGNGKTAGRGHNGAKQRSGFKHKIGFEGGQMPLYKKTPIIHVINNFAKKTRTVTLDMLRPILISGIKKIGKEELVSFRIIRKVDVYKIICGKKNENIDGVEIYADGFSKTARDIIERSGGTCYINKQVKKQNRDDK